MSIDYFPLVFYGLICGLLAGFTPRFLSLRLRVLAGAIIGVAAALGIGEVRTMLGL